MAREIERKFLVYRDRWHPDAAGGLRLRQGYLSTDPARVVRIRTAGDGAYLTVKGVTTGIERAEFEYPIPTADAEQMLHDLCLQPLIDKRRYRVPFGGRVWEVDEFGGANAGLVIAEIELASADERLELPPWIGEEVSADPRYFNANLIARPYRTWPRHG